MTPMAPQILRYIQITSAFCKRAMDQLLARQAAEKQASDAAGVTLQKLLATAVIKEANMKQAQSLLSTHTGTMELLRNAVTKIAELRAESKSAGSLGEGVDPKTAGADAGDATDAGQMSPFVGQRTSQKKASDHALLRGLGIDS